MDALLRIRPLHRGRFGDADIELAALELLLQESPGDPLTTAEANAVIERLHVYRNVGDWGFDPAEDILVTTVETLALVAGIQAVPFYDGDPEVRIRHGEDRRYFVVAELTAEAAAQEPNSFFVTHRTEASSSAEDVEHDLPLLLEFTPDFASGTVGAAVEAVIGDLYFADEIVLHHRTIDGIGTFAACTSITASQLDVTGAGQLTFRAGVRLVLGDGFEVAAGGAFTAVIDPAVGGS